MSRFEVTFATKKYTQICSADSDQVGLLPYNVKLSSTVQNLYKIEKLYLVLRRTYLLHFFGYIIHRKYTFCMGKQILSVISSEKGVFKTFSQVMTKCIETGL